MSKLTEGWRKLLFLLRRSQLDRELKEEMRLHAELKAEKQIAAGMDAEQARLAARRQLGNTTMLHEQSRASWGFPFWESVVQDIRYGLRSLRNALGFSLIAILTLALGIGATTAIFSVVNTVLLRPLPYRDSDRLVELWTTTPMFPGVQMGVSEEDIDNARAQAHALDKIAIYQPQDMSLTGKGSPERMSVVAISADFVSLFSQDAVLGRTLRAGDYARENGDVILLSHALWQRRFGADAKIIGTPVTLEQKPYTVVGVMSPGFSLPGKTDAWVPFVPTSEDRMKGWGMFFGIAKLRAGVPVAAAQTELSRIVPAIARQHLAHDPAFNFSFLVKTLHEGIVGDGKSQLLILLAAVGFLLLIACANVSNLVLARGLERRQEVAVRTALGATRMRIARQFATEGLLLAMLGGLGGLVLAAYGVDFFRHFAPADFPRLQEVRIEPAMAGIAFSVSAIASVLCGLAPALAASRTNPSAAMKQKPGTAIGPSRLFSVRNILVVGEVALALVLLTGSALLVQSMIRLLNVETGLRTDHVVMGQVELPAVRYPSEETKLLFVRRLLDSLRSQTQLNAVALSNNSVLARTTSLLSFDDPSFLGGNEKRATVAFRQVSPEFFQTLGIPLLSGRLFDDHDGSTPVQVVIINESMAKRYFRGQNPVGKVVKLSKDSKDLKQIVGVVGDTRDNYVGEAPQPQLYSNILQSSPFDSVFIIVRSQLEGTAVTGFLEKSVWALDKDLPVTNVRSMTDVIAETVSGPRFRTWLISGFAISGLALTLVGIYGVVSYSVGQRIREMGIRMALGASRENVLRLVLAGGARLALVGAGMGIAGSLFLMRVLSSQLYEIRPNDPATLVGTALLLSSVALLASYVPARRATRVDPMVALREE